MHLSCPCGVVLLLSDFLFLLSRMRSRSAWSAVEK